MRMTSRTNGANGERTGNARTMAAWALLCLAFVVGAATFALTYHGLFGYGENIAKLGRLAIVVPIAVDGLSLAGVAASFVNAHARARVRAYGWMVFGIGAFASIGGQLADADERHLPAVGWVGSAFWPLALALVSHLAVVTWRHRPTAHIEPMGVPVEAEPAEVAEEQPSVVSLVKPAPPRERRPNSVRRPAVRSRRKVPHAKPDAKAVARERFANGEADCGSLASDLGVTKRAVQMWVKDLRPMNGAVVANANGNGKVV